MIRLLPANTVKLNSSWQNLQSAQITVMSYVGMLRLGIEVEKNFINEYKFKSCIANAFNMISEAAAVP